MPHGSYSLGETAANQKMMRLVCDKCGRRGQYRIDRLLEQYGPDIAMPDLRHELAQCTHTECIAFVKGVEAVLAWISTEGEFPNIRNANRFTRLKNFAVAGRPIGALMEACA